MDKWHRKLQDNPLYFICHSKLDPCSTLLNSFGTVLNPSVKLTYLSAAWTSAKVKRQVEQTKKIVRLQPRSLAYSLLPCQWLTYYYKYKTENAKLKAVQHVDLTKSVSSSKYDSSKLYHILRHD